MVSIHSVNRSGIVNALITIAILLAVLSFLTAGSLFLFLVLASATAAIAGGVIAWRRAHGASPFAEHPEETLHLR